MSGISTAVEIRDRVTGSLNRITASLYSATTAFGALDRASETTFNSEGVQAMTREMYAYETRIQQLEADLVNANERLVQMENQTRQTSHTADMLRNAFAAIGGAIGVKTVLETSDAFVQTTSRLDMMNDGLQTADELVNAVYQSAQDARGGFSEMADVVARFGNNAGSAFSSTEEVVQFANLLQKQMTIAGASTSEASAAMLQLSQGLGSGVLRGDELNSIFEQAPNLIQNIASHIEKNEEVAKHMADAIGVTYEEMSTNAMGHIRSLAEEGQLTAGLVKAAIFGASDEINENFENIPITWGQIWQKMQNTALMKFQPILQRINQIANSERFQGLFDKLVGGIAAIADAAVPVLDMVIGIATGIIDNWSMIAPVVWGVVAAMGAYTIALGVHKAMEIGANIVKGISEIMEYRHAKAVLANASAHSASAVATASATVAQSSFNTALLACPLTWILLIIIAVIAAIYGIVAAINHFTGSSISATGVIMGAITTAVAVIWNIIYGLFSFIVGIGVELYNLIATFANFFANVFNNPVGAIINLFHGLFDYILGVVESAAGLIDAILGSDLSGAVAGFRDKVATSVEEIVGEQTVVMEKVTQDDVLGSIGLDRWSYGDAYDTGYSMGEGIDKSLGDMFKEPEIPEFDSAYTGTGAGSVADASNATAGNTADIADAVDISNENLKYLHDIAEKEAINRFTTAEIKVDMKNNNSINSNMDIDGMINHLKDGLTEALITAAEGVHK